MKIENGVNRYDPGEVPKFPVPLETMEGSKYGWKLAGAGKDAKWMPASEDDFRSSESRRLGIEPSDVDLTRLCQPSGQFCDPMSCGAGHLCVLTQNGGHYYCVC